MTSCLPGETLKNASMTNDTANTIWMISTRPTEVDRTCDDSLLARPPSRAKEDLDKEDGAVVLLAIECHSSTARPLNGGRRKRHLEDAAEEN